MPAPQMQYWMPAVPACLLKTLPLVLTIALFAPAYAEPLTGPEESLHRLQLSGENDWQLSSYQQHLVRPKSAWSLGDETPESDGLLGLSFRSRLPFAGMSSTLEYAFSHQGDGLADAGDRQLLQLRLEHRWQGMTYGLRYFSIGESFGGDPLAERTLAQHGLGAAGEGGEFWFDWMLADVKVRPSATITSHRDQVRGENLALALAHPEWQISWHSRRDEDGALVRLSRGVSGNFRLRQDDGFLPAMNLGLTYLNQAEFNQVEASLQFSKRLFEKLGAGPDTSIGAGVSYRREERTGVTDEGLGINLTLQLDLSAS